jgi:ABC-type nitrate/sulfonate/bicarbonate transport system substrate-binding protein
MRSERSIREPTPLRVSLFGGVSALPIMLAEDHGHFAAEGLSVEIVRTANSHDLMQGLVSGEFSIVHAAPDNFIEWRDRTGALITTWIAGPGGPVSLVARGSISSVSDLRGRDIAVDAVESGFVSVLREILRSAGLADDDVSLVALGSTNLRFRALMEGETTATMLTLPWSTKAEEAGFVRLADQYAVLPGLPGSCGASLEPWLLGNPEVADAYFRAVCAATTWVLMPDSATELTRIIEKVFDVSGVQADRIRGALVAPSGGCPPSCFVDVGGFATLCDLRLRNGQPPRQEPADYISFDPYRRVLGFGLLSKADR